MALTVQDATLAIIVAALLAIIYSFRYLIVMERRIAKIDQNIERLTKNVLSEEMKIERAEKRIAGKLGRRRK